MYIYDLHTDRFFVINTKTFDSCDIADEITNAHVNIDDKETDLLIIASIETLKHQNKNCGKGEVFAMVKDSLEEAIKLESFAKSLVLLQASNSIKCNIISNHTCLSIPKVQFLKFLLKKLAA